MSFLRDAESGRPRRVGNSEGVGVGWEDSVEGSSSECDKSFVDE